MANNAWAGSRIAGNAAENNYLMPKEKSKLVEELDKCGGNQGCKDQVQTKYQAISEPRDKEFDKAYADCKSSSNNCAGLNKIHYDLRNKLTKDGNDYYKSNPKEFEKLSPLLSIFHTYKRTDDGSVLLFGQNDNTKYVHPILGYEVVLDSNKKIVTDPLNAGTYNFYNPNRDEIKPELRNLLGNDALHKKYDVYPYTKLGNAPYPIDPTKPDQRDMFKRGVGSIKFW